MKSIKVAGQMAVAIAALAMLGGCCIEDCNKRVAALNLEISELGKANTDLQQEKRVLEERVASLQNEIARLNELIASNREPIALLKERIAQLEKALAERDRAYAELAAMAASRPVAGRGGALPKEVERLLDQLAKNYPNLLTFDAATGQLRFASDVTFDLGKVDLKPEAQKALAELAAILAQDKAKPVVLKIVGHTCTTRIVKPETLAKYPNNQALSEARAKSVGDFLVQHTIESSRITTQGMGESQLIDPANPKGARNRRVEIYLSMPEVPATAPATGAPAIAPVAPPAN